MYSHFEADEPDLVGGRLADLLAEGEDEILALLAGDEGQHGDHAVEHLLQLNRLDQLRAVLVFAEGRVAHADDLVQVILDALLGPLGRYLGAETLVVDPELLGLSQKEDIEVKWNNVCPKSSEVSGCSKDYVKCFPRVPLACLLQKQGSCIGPMACGTFMQH